MRSIRARLMAILFATTGLVWLCAVAWIYLSTQTEVERVLDARLVEAARMVNSLITDHRIEIAMAADTASDMPAPFAATPPDYQRQLSCQIWSLSGALVGRSEGAPEERLADSGAGFSETRIDGETWRVYVVDNADLGLRVMVGDNLQIRDRLVNDVILGLLLPAGLILPLAGGLIWFSVRRGLAPLDAVAGVLSARPADDLSALELKAPPDELRPAVSALNGLFRRVEDARHRERNFTAYAAHELKTPLAGLKTQVQVALVSEDPEVTRHALTQIASGVDRASRLVRQLLDLAKVDASDSAVALGPIDLSALVVATVDELAFTARRRNVAMRTHLLPGAVGRGEPGLVTVAVRNIVENAILHSAEGEAVDLRVLREGNEVSIEVADTGPGMRDEDIAQATERFFRGRSRSAAGSGLGLAIVQTAMDRSKGRLEIRNGPGCGLLGRGDDLGNWDSQAGANQIQR